MVGNSRSVVSSQAGPHGALGRHVARHRAALFRRPVAAHTADAFASLAARIDPARPIVLDAGCGTGESTLRLAARHPDVQLVGVDKSAHRLARAPAAASREPRLHLLRADLQDFWRLARDAGWRLAAHYLLYPNPWPKAAQLQRRWHGHPVFPELLALGGRLELRSNWDIYVREFAAALAACGVPSRIERIGETADGECLTPFERKYLASGQPCLRLIADLDAAAVPA